MKVRFGARSAEQARVVNNWWRENRPAAPSLFADELGEALRLLKYAPSTGEPFGHWIEYGVRRLLLPRTRYHVYYVFERATAVVQVLAIWSSLRGKPPSLGFATKRRRSL
jgi:plasmid stabilization system protein ParE